jgi:protein-tyrosine phosphatase
MIDVHAHFLPGVDDGAETLEEALAMCRMATSDGIDEVIVTPHQCHDQWPNEDRPALERTFASLVEASGGHPRLHLGAEIRVDSQLLGEVDALPGGMLLPMARSRYLLLELPPLPIGPEPRTIVHELVLAGWRPILAHPERIAWLAEDRETLVDLCRLGARMQLTAMSVAGSLGHRAHSCSRFLLGEGLADVIASDSHDTLRRIPRLSEAWYVVTDEWGEDEAVRLMATNPRAIIDDAEMQPRPKRP